MRQHRCLHSIHCQSFAIKRYLSQIAAVVCSGYGGRSGLQSIRAASFAHGVCRPVVAGDVSSVGLSTCAPHGAGARWRIRGSADMKLPISIPPHNSPGQDFRIRHND